MKKIYLLPISLFAIQAYSQILPYDFSTFNEPYVSLSEASSANGEEIWDDPEYLIPIGFTMDLMGEQTSNILLLYPGAQLIPTGVETEVSLLFPYGEDIMDTGNDKIGSQSPILYTTEGLPGSRVFKLEWSNVGFYSEWENLGTFSNTMSFQLWFYETTNDIEYRFGGNTIKDFDNIHPLGGAIVGLAKNVSLDTGAWEALWLIGGDPTNPTVTPYVDPETAPDPSILLNAVPPSGTVYHFDTGIVSVDEQSSGIELNLYPTRSDNQVYINISESLPYRIYDAVGNLVEAGRLNSGLNSINVTEFASGLYVLQVNEGIYVQSRKFVRI